MDELLDTITTNLAKPLEAEVDGVRARQHNLRDQLAVRDAVLSSSAIDQPNSIPFRLYRFRAPGTQD